MKNLTKKLSFFVFAYIFLYMIVTLLQAATKIVPLLWPEYTLFNPDFSIPMDIWGWGLFAIVAGYSGTDRICMSVKSAHMQTGTADLGNISKLKKMMYCMFFVLLETYLLWWFFPVDLPLSAITTTFVSIITIYSTGGKAVKIFQSVDMSGDLDWANEHDQLYQK